MNRRAFTLKGLAAIGGASIGSSCSTFNQAVGNGSQAGGSTTTPPAPTFPFPFSAWQDRKTTDKYSWGTAGQLGYQWGRWNPNTQTLEEPDTLIGDGNGRVGSQFEAVEVRHRDAYQGYYPDMSWYIPNSTGAWPEGQHLLLKQDQRLLDSFKARCRSAHSKGLLVMIDWHGGGHDILFLLPTIAQLHSEGIRFIANTNERFEAACAPHLQAAFMELWVGANNYFIPQSTIEQTANQWLGVGVEPLIELQGDHPQTQGIYNFAISKGSKVGYRHSVDNNALDGNGNHIADHLPFNN